MNTIPSEIPFPYIIAQEIDPASRKAGKTTTREVVSDTGDASVSLADGFKQAYEKMISLGGKYVTREAINGLFYTLSNAYVYRQQGGLITYNAAVATAIGGYPQGAILWYKDDRGRWRLIESIDGNNSNEPSGSSNILNEIGGESTGKAWKYITYTVDEKVVNGGKNPVQNKGVCDHLNDHMNNTNIHTNKGEKDAWDKMANGNIGNLIYPVGAIYFSVPVQTNQPCPLASIVKQADGSDSVWSTVSKGRCVMSCNSTSYGKEIAAEMPALKAGNTIINLTTSVDDGHTHTQGGWKLNGSFPGAGYSNAKAEGVFEAVDGGADANNSGSKNNDVVFKMSTNGKWTGSTSEAGIHSHTLSSPTFSTSIKYGVDGVYGNSNTVQPPAFVVDVWRRIL